MKKITLLILYTLLLVGCGKVPDNKEILEAAKEVELTEFEYSRIASMIDLLPYEVESLDINTLTNQEKIGLAFEILSYENTGENHVATEYSINKTTVTEVLKRYFGKKITVDMENYMCEYCLDEVLYKYNESTEEFEYTYHGHGYYSVQFANYISKVTQKDNQYYVEVVKVFAGPAADIWIDFPTQLYKTAKDAYNQTNMVIDIKGDTNYCYYDSDIGGDTCDLEKVAKAHSELFNTYVYTFDIEDGVAMFSNFKQK